MVPLLAIHRDEKYFSEPMKYKPLRFLQSGGDVGQCKDKTEILSLNLVRLGVLFKLSSSLI